MRDEAPARNLCMEFWRGKHFAYLNQDGGVNYQATVSPEKPQHRFRLSRNFIFDIIEREVSRSIQRVPGYEVSASTTEPMDYYAAKTSEKVARYGYDKWGLRDATEETVRFALNQDMGFAWPYFDNTKGTVIDPEQGIAEGEICIELYGPNEVFWEPGVKYAQSAWMGIQQAKPLEEVQAMTPLKLKADASAGFKDTNRTKQSENLCLVTNYFERPTIQNSEGTWLVIVQGKVIDEKAYPVVDSKKQVLDEPLLVPLSYAMDPDSDTDVGLTRHLIDPMRTVNDCIAKQLEWKNLCLNPQFIMRNGVWKGAKRNDAPGMIYKVFGNSDIQIIPVPPIPPELEQMKQAAVDDMYRIAAQNEPPSQVESGKGLQAFESIQERRAAFISKLAQFHSALMRRCLLLVQTYYTEERLLTIQGRYGPEILSAFKGADLHSQVDVTVRPASLEPRTKDGVRQELMNLTQMFPGAFSPEQVMAAMDQGSGEKLIESYEQDVRRAHEVIQKIKFGPEVLFNESKRPLAPGEGMTTDPLTGQETPIMEPIEGPDAQPILDEKGRPQMTPMVEAPGWLPRPFDNIPVQKKVFEDFMKTPDFDMLDNGMKAACFQYYAALEEGEARKAQKAQMQQAQMAQNMGEQNAARPTPNGDKPLPSMPALT